MYISFFFSYNTKPVLKNLSFNLEAGSTLLIKGPSGSGKSTIIKALIGFISLKSGSIKIAGLVPEDFLNKYHTYYLFVLFFRTVILLGNMHFRHKL
jgi:ABC-type multidrug transport system fused ATPase/permease subunit